MKRWKIVLLCAAFVTLAAGCKKKDVQETTEAPTETASAEIPEASVTLGEYKGISVTDTYEEITDEDLETRIQQILEEPIYVEVDRPAEDGDMVNIDYVGMKDGVPFDRGTADNYDLLLGSDNFIDGFEDGLVGAKTGDELSLNLTFPENYHASELAGQDVVFDVTVNAVKEKTDVELTDEFIPYLSKKSKTVEEYRAEVRETMEQQARDTADILIQNNVIEKVLENATFTGLDEQVEAQFNEEIAALESALSQQGSTLEQYAAIYSTDVDSFKEQLREEIRNTIEINLVTDAIAEQEGLEADDKSRQKLAELNRVENVIDLVTQFGQEAVDNTAKRIRVMEFLAENAKVE